MYYSAVKDSLGRLFNHSIWSRKLFYRILDILLLRTWHIKREVRKWKRHAPYNAHILDAGSGFGQYAYYLSKLHSKWNILGIDTKTQYIADCNEFFRTIGKTRVFFRRANLLDFREEKAFDLILAVDVLEYLSDDRKALDNFLFSLRPGGTLILSVPSEYSDSDKLWKNHHNTFAGEPLREGYRIPELREKLKTAGFSKIKMHYSHGIPGKAGWKMAIKWPAQLLRISRLFLILLPFYFLLLIVPILILYSMDSLSPHRSGNGLIVKAVRESR